MKKTNFFLCLFTMICLITTLLPSTVILANGSEPFEQLLEDNELVLIIGGNGGGGGGDDNDDDNDYDDPEYVYETESNYSIDYGIASLVFFQENRTPVNVEIGKKAIDSWTVSGSFSGSAIVRSLFNIGLKFEGSYTHKEETSTNFVIPPYYCMKIYSKPYTETEVMKYIKYEVYNGRKTEVERGTGIYQYSDKKVTYTGYYL